MGGSVGRPQVCHWEAAKNAAGGESALDDGAGVIGVGLLPWRSTEHACQILYRP